MHDKARKILGAIDVLLIVMALAIALGFGFADPMPLITFVLFFAALASIIIFWRYKIPIVIVAVGVLLALKILTVETFIEYAHINVIAFLIGMMVVVAFLEDRGFFDALLGIMVSKFQKSARLLFVAMLALSALFAALLGEVSSTLFMCAIALKLAKKYELRPLPFVISVVFATNVGSAFTLLGNPVGVLIAFEGNLTFSDFLVWALPTGLIVLAATIALCLRLFRKDIAALDEGMKKERAASPADEGAYVQLLRHGGMRLPVAIFVGTIVGLVVYRPLEDIMGIERNTLLLAIPLIAAAVSLIAGKSASAEVIEKRVEWPTLLFFIFFFGIAGALQYAGVTAAIAGKIQGLSGGNTALAIAVVIVIAGISSAFMDNVLAVATFAPIVQGLGANAFPLWWALLFGACFMGNLTIIGSSANIIAIGLYEKGTGKSVSFYEWLKYGAVVATVQLLIALALTVVLHVYAFPA
ncbi:MAG: anion permease [Euryarchaeota archaeon]|nr:anion permease [Euryarchaeota archaeon]